jgi:hypothetical protein
MSGVERIAEWQVFPTGCDPEDINALSFIVSVKWRGTYQGKSGGGWSVTHNSAELSRGGLWTYCVPRFRRWQHRWETFEEAQQQARAVVDNLSMNGRTWAQWQERKS